MRIHKLNNYDDMSELAAAIVAAQITKNNKSVLGLATGSAPLGLYARLIEMNKKGMISFKDAKIFNLDEYLGLSTEHPQSFYSFLKVNLFDCIDVDINNIHLLNGNCDDIEAEIKAYESAIETAGGIDFQILGIGHDGHIAFNMPGDDFDSYTHVAELSEKTIRANARFFGNNTDMVPKRALTLGIRNIMNVRHIILLASGKEKANILNESIYGPLTPDIPASILRMHNNIDVLSCD